MQNVLELMNNVLQNGVSRNDRTGIGSKFLSGHTLRWDLSEGFPMITTRHVAFRIAFEETMMFLRGQTDTNVLSDKGIDIWKGNTSREFLDNRGLNHLPVGSLGKGYSHAWRNFGGDIDQSNGVDQIKNLLEGLKNNPTDRRHIVSAWNPMDLNATPLPPCHLMHMYSVDTERNRLNSCFILRSNDLYHGLPYNIMGYAFLNELFSRYLGLTPGELVYFGWDCHIYAHQEEAVKVQVTREPRPLPKLEINKHIGSFEDVLSVTLADVKIVGYDPHPALPKVPMAV